MRAALHVAASIHYPNLNTVKDAALIYAPYWILAGFIISMTCANEPMFLFCHIWPARDVWILNYVVSVKAIEVSAI